MRSRLGGFVVLLGTNAVLFSACGDMREPPGGDTSRIQPTQVTSVGPGGGDMTEPLEICSCIVSQQNEPIDGPVPYPCERCWEDTWDDGGGCGPLQEACQLDAGCQAIAQCVGECYKTEDIEGCVGACAFPRDRDDSTELYHQRLDCFCGECTDKCDYIVDAVCPVDGGGMGGIGGIGGAGGTM